MRNFFRLFIPLIINPYYYFKKIKKKMIKNRFNYENALYNRVSFISLAIANILKKKNYNECKYLEIGVFDNKVFNTIPLPINQKIGVDPQRGGTHKMTSDDFFKSNKEFFDVIFIDGLHSYEQCSNDCINSMKFLNENGLIIFHDMLPRSDVEEKQDMSGDVWKVACEILKINDAKFVIANIDQGVGILKINKNSKYSRIPDIKEKKFSDYINYFKKNLPIVNCQEALDFINNK